jgi:hypothetical protein
MPPAVAAAGQAGPADSPVLTGNPVIQASLTRIGQGSGLWRRAIEAIRASGRRALVLTPDQVVVSEAADGREGRPFDEQVVAEVAPVPGRDSRVDVVLVVVNLELLEHAHARLGSLPGELDADLDRVLVHEIYGHALPYLLAGDLSGRCADPGPRERPADACAIRRENEVRAELRLGRRVDHGLEGLALARRER